MILLHSAVGIFKRFSTIKTPSTSQCSDWKSQVALFRLVTEISSILLQRRNWITHLKNVKSKLPKSRLTPQIFLQIIRETRKCPATTLDFFDWAKTHLRFEPDHRSYCWVIEIATESGLLERAETLLRPMAETNSPSTVVRSMHQWFEGKVSLSISLSLLLEYYAIKGSYQNGLEVFSSMRRLKLSPSLHAYNSLLNSLVKEYQITMALCLYSAMIRNLVVSNELTWDLVAQILCELGKSKSVIKLMETGVESCKIYTNLIKCYSRNREFDAAFSILHEMNDKKLELSFYSYGCILDDVCRLGDAKLINKVLTLMVEKKFLTLGDSAIIEKLCDMGRTFASEMLFRKACIDETVRLQDSTYGSMLKALSKKERTKETVEVYRLICRKGIIIDDSCYTEFANTLCRGENRSEEQEELLVDVIKRGFVPCTQNISEVLSYLCRKRRWKHAEKLLDAVMEMEVCFDSFSCGLLMEHYCRSKKLEKAMELHEKIKKMKGSLDVNGYNIVLDELMKQEKMVEEVVGVFEYMKEMNKVDSKSFVIMIQGLCGVKEMKKAMKFHDEMMKLGLKPDLGSYKRLILGFK